MTFWILSDTHLGHNKMVLNGYREEGFDEETLRQICYYVKEDDVMIHLGDVSFYKHELYNTLIAKHCKTWLVRGNHDKKSYSWYLKHGWDCVADSIEMNMFGKRILLTHKPVIVGSGVINVHGHLHDPEVSHGMLEFAHIVTENHKLVSIEGDTRVFKLKHIVGM